MNLAERVQEIRTGFSPTFWIANTLELFERLAFYGAKAILAVFLANKMGLVEDAGKLTGLYTSLIFGLPVLSGVLVDKYGFRRTLMACFAIFAIGYFAVAFGGMDSGKPIVDAMGTKVYALAALIITAIGGSLIKPCIVGTVAISTDEKVRAYGFSIYYTLVNFGGFFGPLVAIPIRENLGIEYVLVMSSITSLLLLIGTFIFFKEPRGAGSSGQRTFAKVLSDFGLVLTNFRFMSFLVIFSGFWIMFWQVFFLLPFYGTDVLNFERFEILETIDALCIILLTIPVTALVKKLRPIQAMILGFAFATVCWFIIGAMNSLVAVFIGVALFALGEATQSPRFYEYVSKLAPQGQTGTFMGFAFLPVAIGAFVAGFLADYLRLNYMMTNPSGMWFIVGGIGVVATILMILYNSFLAPKPAQQS
jgi:proton-dependent oligopeptide transporter, POT family